MCAKPSQKATLLSYFKKTENSNVGTKPKTEHTISEEDITTEAGPSIDLTAVQSFSGMKHSSKHRESGINSEWFKKFDWLVVKDNGMMCSTCMKYGNGRLPNKEVSWITVPCRRLRKESLVDHEKSKLHTESCSYMTEKRVLEKNGVGHIEKSISVFNNMQRDAFVGSLRSMYWLAKNELPHTTLYKKLLEHCTAMGCSYLKHLNVGSNANYTSKRIMQELLDVLASEIKSEIMKNIYSADYFSVLCDETTDIAVLKQLIIYIKHVSQLKKEVRVSFVSTCNIIDGKAETIANKVIETLSNLGLKSCNLVGLGSDGAAVMIGKQKGVAKLLKDETDGLMVNCHCINHRLALASAQAVAEVPYLVKFNDILRQLFSFFQNSSVRMAGLTLIQDILNSPQIKLKMPRDTRWLSHNSAVQSLRECMVSVIAALEREATERNDITAEGLRKHMKTYNFVASLMMLSDVLPHLSHLSKAWQRQDVNLAEIEPVLEAAKLSIIELKDNPGSHFQNLHHHLASEWSDLGINYSEDNVIMFKKTIYNKYIVTVINHLEARFPDMPIISSFSKLFSGVSYKQSEASEILFNYYSKNGNPPVLNYESSKQEWAVASKMLGGKSYKNLDPKKIMQKLATTAELRESFPNLAKLAAVGLSIPVSTAECERGFSALKRIKTCLRNRLNQNTLNNLLMISLEGPDPEDFDFERAAENWSSKKKRRINI